MATDPRSELARLWTLDPDVLYLNHGSFGACPRLVLEHQAELRARMEREPVDFLVRALPGRLGRAREQLGAFVGADPDGIVFVPNATTGVNAASRAWDLGAGDEILLTDHTYGACRKAAAFVARQSGAVVVEARVPFPLRGPQDVIEPVLGAVSPRTKLALLDHVTSPTALVFPIRDLVRELRARNVETIVDGAHALGMVALDLTALGAACYTANAHKWLCTPKGAALLYVRQDFRERIRPLMIGHGYDPVAKTVRFREEWDSTGTVDPTPWLSIPEALRVLGDSLPGGWPELMDRNHGLACRARAILLEALEVDAPCPETMLGSMASVPLPAARPDSPVSRFDQDALAAWTRERGIESWFFPWACAGGKVLRLSAQLYNDEAQYRRLAELIADALRAE